MKKIALLLCATSLLASFQAMAYQVTIPVQNRNKSTLQQGFQAGAQKLILSLTASDQALATLANDIKQARNWVDEYTTTSNPGNEEQPWLLQASYSDRSISQLLRRHNLRSWKKAPAPTQVLLKTTNDTTLQDDDPRWQALRTAALVRGFTFQRIDQVPDKLTNNLLIAVIPAKDDPEAAINWSWYHQQQWQQWQQPTGEQWANKAADSIGQQLIQAQPQQEISSLTPIHLQISGLRDFSDYAQAIQALRRLHNIQSMTDDGLQGDQLSLTLITHASIPDIKQALDNIRELHPRLNLPGVSDTDLNYAWGEPSPPAATELHYKKPEAVDEESFRYDNAYNSD